MVVLRAAWVLSSAFAGERLLRRIIEAMHALRGERWSYREISRKLLEEYVVRLSHEGVRRLCSGGGAGAVQPVARSGAALQGKRWRGSGSPARKQLCFKAVAGAGLLLALGAGRPPGKRQRGGRWTAALHRFWLFRSRSLQAKEFRDSGAW